LIISIVLKEEIYAMSRNRLRLTVSIVVLLLASLACQFSFSSAKVENARMASDPEGNSLTTIFGHEDTFYLLGELKNAPDDTKLKAVWTAVEVEGTAPETLLDEAEVQGSSGPFTFSLEKSQPIWPVGSYKVDLYLEDELNQTFEFQVERTVQAEIQNARLARDSEGVETTTTFAPSDSFHLLADLVNAPPGGLPVKTVWTAVQVEGAESQEIDSVIETIENGPIVGSLTSSSGAWPVGQYRVELYLNEALAQTIDFEVVGTSTPTSAPPSASTTRIENTYMAYDQDGTRKTEVFGTQDPFHLLFDLVDAPDDTVVGTTWLMRSSDTTDYTQINESEYTFGTGSYYVRLTSDSGVWEAGEYKVELYLDGNYYTTVFFSVQ